MRNTSLALLVFASLGFGQVFRTPSWTNFCKYISTDSSENRTVAIDVRTPEKAVLVDFNLGETTTYDITWMLRNQFTGDLGGSNLFIFTKGIVADDSDIYLIYAHQGSGYGPWIESHGYYGRLYIINFMTREKVFDSELRNYFGFKSGELRFSQTGTYLIATAAAQDYFTWDHTLILKLNALDLTNAFPDRRKSIPLFGP